MIDPDMQEIAGEFVIEARETLEALDGKFVELERRPSPELIDDIFRAMHTIKGAAGFLSLARIVEVAHAGEDVMGRLRSGGLALSESIVDAVLETVDVLKALIEDVASGADSGIATEGVVRRLRGILAEDGAAKAAEPVDRGSAPGAEPTPGTRKEKGPKSR
ncbi:MAG: Hpt domain-containing protein, partial [Candidatus Methylomirabilis sp.]|nr:Hpt domain-containing protein [Deltaproteobacteria bacterium]